MSKNLKMNLPLTQKDNEEFLIRLYFDLTEGSKKAAAKRAYRDFSRTLRDLSKDEKEKRRVKNELENILLEQIEIVLNQSFRNQEEFDFWHQKTCEKLRKSSDKLKLTIGQAQKWVNMTLKYMYVLKEERIEGINKNIRFFHIPIDNIIQEKFAQERKMWKLRDPWSKVDSYSIYLDYQKQVRENYKEEIPFVVEFRLFNEGATKHLFT
ncbi:MAG: hypothetical protein JNL70_08255 [Saprospiraceae bacterium]|nr:hypothetical protein [Saprospiraceae bacterium]